MSIQIYRRRNGVGTVAVAVFLIAIGGYYLVRNGFGIDLPELDAQIVVPFLAVLAGAVMLYNAWRDHRSAAVPA